MPTTQEIKEWLIAAVKQFNKADAFDLLCPRLDEKRNFVQRGYGWGGASERAIAHRLAVYLEAAIPKQVVKELRLSVDCEFNRHLGLGKVHTIPKKLIEIVEDAKRKAKPVSDDDSFYFFSVAPDIILHQRGIDDNNLLVVELKKDSNHEVPEYDNLKLECFTGNEPGYEYRVGAKVTAHDQVDPYDRSLEVTAWYAEGVQRKEDQI
jgi:hypothetical protein